MSIPTHGEYGVRRRRCKEADSRSGTTEPGPATTTRAVAETTTIPLSPTLEIVATDFEFSGLPETALQGTILKLVNESPAEFHEMTLVRLDRATTEHSTTSASHPRGTAGVGSIHLGCPLATA